MPAPMWLVSFGLGATNTGWPELSGSWPNITFPEPPRYVAMGWSIHGQGDFFMGQRIDQFCEDLRVKLTDADDSLHKVKQSVDDRNATAAQNVHEHLETVKSRIAARHQKVVEANQSVQDWIESKKFATEVEVASWKRDREKHRLEKRAERAEDYAVAASELAASAVDEAEKAALEAWLARFDADLVD